MIEQAPFFEVLTRTFRRPAMLAQNQASLQMQTDLDFVQTLIPDEVGIGVAQANARLADVDVIGAYVWVLDRNTDYLLRITNTNGGNIPVSVVWEWYEGDY